ncbi:MAG: leucyl/phenylalanyl-tRNA--protein transferase, partial [Pseudomonadales bacterium]
MEIPWLDTEQFSFPSLDNALEEPNGLLAVGGDLSSERLLSAYRCGVFPWYEEGQPLLWWSPSPRCVLFPPKVHISRSMRKLLLADRFEVRCDTAFRSVIEQCSAPRSYTDGTWITQSMKEAYIRLHEQGVAHSVEVWENDQLQGGLYGLAIGQVFFGE